MPDFNPIYEMNGAEDQAHAPSLWRRLVDWFMVALQDNTSWEDRQW